MKAFLMLVAYSPLILLILLAAVLDSALRWHYPIYGTRRVPL
jgi:hypothetical protein